MLFKIGEHTINMDNVAYFQVDQHHLNSKAHLYDKFIENEKRVLVMEGNREDLEMKICDIKERSVLDFNKGK